MIGIKHSLELIVNPFFIIFCFILASAIVLKMNKSLPKVRRLLWVLIIFFMAFCTGWIPRYLTERLEANYSVVQFPDPKVKWVVVLGGGHHERENLPANDLLSGASIKRLIEGVRLLKDLPQAKLLLSGGGDDSRFTEAALLKQLSQWFFISQERIVLEPHSLNTEAQARALESLVHQEPFYLVTSAIHMPRAMFLCKRQGLAPIPAPSDFTFFWYDHDQAKMFIPNIYNLYYSNIVLHELLGRAWAQLTFKTTNAH
ncbi:YdcF family protein [Legionella sp. km772]|uniref:YdcF family protein n=1 Tax=Legionella sp. km772 TaxID=2498111 RepID=UPI000F8D5D15|nr:YdcF family protein [Legionella sp. km772]RUR11909.1 YdcF family protein [Legionella sp. km772]